MASFVIAGRRQHWIGATMGRPGSLMIFGIHQALPRRADTRAIVPLVAMAALVAVDRHSTVFADC